MPVRGNQQGICLSSPHTQQNIFLTGSAQTLSRVAVHLSCMVNKQAAHAANTGCRFHLPRAARCWLCGWNQPSASASWVRFQCEEARWTGQGLLLSGGQRFCGNTDEGSLSDRVAGWGVKPGHCSAASGSRATHPMQLR